MVRPAGVVTIRYAPTVTENALVQHEDEQMAAMLQAASQQLDGLGVCFVMNWIGINRVEVLVSGSRAADAGSVFYRGEHGMVTAILDAGERATRRLPD